MTTMNATPKVSLVVPEQAIPAFQHAILPKRSSAIEETPKTTKGKIQRFLRKSTLITAPTVALGSITGVIVAPQVLELSLLGAMGTMVLGLSGLSFGFMATMASLESVFHGDRTYAPLPPTKEFLEFEESKQKSIIQPFKDWDDVFARNNH